MRWNGLLAGATWFELLEEVVSFIINEDECREVFYFYFPDSFHSEFRIFYTFNALDIVLSIECVEYPELGMEAIWKISVEDFPAFILVDDKGNDFFKKLGL